MTDTDTPTEVLAQSVEENGDVWRHDCGTVLMAARVHHSFHDGPFPLSGSGEVQVQTVPYCPKCHEKPSSYGAPLHPGDKDWPTVRIKRVGNFADDAPEPVTNRPADSTLP